jgi:hypothetical protein
MKFYVEIKDETGDWVEWSSHNDQDYAEINYNVMINSGRSVRLLHGETVIKSKDAH